MLAQTDTLPPISTEDAAMFAGFFGTFMIIALVVFVLSVIATWRIFTKAGEEGWKAIIPIYNTIILLKIVGRPWWWLLLMLIPVVGIVIAVIVFYDLSKSFGHGVGFTVGLLLLSIVFLMILGFGADTYRGPGAMMSEPGVAPPQPPLPPAPA